MAFLTIQERAKIYVDAYCKTPTRGEYLKEIKGHELDEIEAELAWESIDHYEDTRL